jgi:hypothetical protein
VTRGQHLLGHSAIFREATVLAQALQFIGSDEVLDVRDCDVEIYGTSGSPTFRTGGLVLTEHVLALFRGRGFLGPKKPEAIDLRTVDKVVITRDRTNIARGFDVRVNFTDPLHAMLHMWFLRIGKQEDEADRLMRKIHGACQALFP